jgi:hypothetical protein
MLEASGKTPDGKTVVRGVYRFYETTGLPLDVIFDCLRSNAMLPDWSAFVLEAVEAGMQPERAISMLEPAIADTYGPGVRNVVVARLRNMIVVGGEPPPATIVLDLLGEEYDRIYAGIDACGPEPTYDQTMDVIASVVGREIVDRFQGECVGMRIVSKLPEDRLHPL